MTDTVFIANDGDQELLDTMLRQVVENDSSDLHVREGEAPFMRRHGQLVNIPDMAEVSSERMRGLVTCLTELRPSLREEIEQAGEADLSYELEGVARYRVNIFRERGRYALTLRVISNEVPHIDKVGVPPILKQLVLEHHGLILVTGATGSGKTTSLAAMIDHRNRESANHILTIEDPIEIVHKNQRSIVSQREVGTDTADFSQALRRALRQDPDVILIGEIRDEETMRTALAAAETGHLVLATLHTINAQETIARVLDLFPSEAEPQARAMLAGALKGIVSQRLAVTVDGGRTPVVEVLVNTARIQDCITNPEDTAKINDAIADGGYYGMQTFDQALISLILDGRITEEEATRLTTSPQNFKLALSAAVGQREVDQKRKAAEAAAREAAERQAAEQAAREAAAAAEREARRLTPAPLPGAATAAAGAPPASMMTPTPAAGSSQTNGAPMAPVMPSPGSAQASHTPSLPTPPPATAPAPAPAAHNQATPAPAQGAFDPGAIGEIAVYAPDAPSMPAPAPAAPATPTPDAPMPAPYVPAPNANPSDSGLAA